jgi:predicted permease
MAFFIFGMGLLYVFSSFFTKKKIDTVIPISTMFMNTANVGFPVTLFVFGPQAFEKAVILDLAMILILFSFGVGFLSRKYSSLLGMPVLYAAVAAFGFSLGNIHFPESLLQPIGLMGQITVPAMIISLGCKIADIQKRGKFSLYLPVVASLIRFLGGMALGLIFIWSFGLTGMTAAVVLLYAALPAPVMSYILAQKYHRNEALAAEIVLVSNLGALLTLPIVLYLSKVLFL